MTIRRPMLARFLELAGNPTGTASCWLWTASGNDQGYGKFCVAPGFCIGNSMAHRVSYMLFVGTIPPGLQVLHKCDTPPCVNPRHLFLGTQKDNMDDCRRKGRDRRPKGETHGSAKLNLAAAMMIRHLYATGNYRQDDLAEQFKVSSSTIRNVLAGRHWIEAAPED